jgi:hypothetical protein
VTFIRCGGGLEICDRTNIAEAPPMPCATCTRYVDSSIAAHGFRSVDIRSGWARLGDGWPELDELSLTSLEQVVDDGLPLGELMQVPASWFLLRGKLDDDPLGPMTARRFLRSARRVARGLRAALDDLVPDVVVLLNGRFFFESIAWALCRTRDIPIVSYERGFIDGTLVFSRNFAACRYDIGEAWKTAAGRPLRSDEEVRLDDYLRGRETGTGEVVQLWKGVRFDHDQFATSGRRVVLFSNITWDSAVIGEGIGFAQIHDWLAAAVEYFRERPADELIIRIHPAEVKLPGKRTREPLGMFLSECFPRLPDNVRVIDADDPTSSYPLMDAADVGLVYTSTTGLELALRGKPVLVAGQTHYRGKGFTIDVTSPEQFVHVLDDVLKDPGIHRPDVQLARRYANAFFFDVPVKAPGVAEPYPGLARLTVTDLEDLRPGVDKGLDRICDMVLDGLRTTSQFS